MVISLPFFFNCFSIINENEIGQEIDCDSKRDKSKIKNNDKIRCTIVVSFKNYLGDTTAEVRTRPSRSDRDLCGR